MAHRQIQLQSLNEADDFANLFTELDPALEEIRLLEVVNGAGASSMVFQWHVVSLLDHKVVPRYSALSYTWDDIGDPQTITIGDGSLVVQETVYQFLKQNARGKHATLLFIDAVCINQMNNNERNHQVRLMSKIYNFARDVVMWFWPVKTDSVAGLKALLDDERMGHLRNSPAYASRTEQGWRAALRRDYAPFLHDLHKLRYWKRVWIVQEVVLARSVRLWYGLISLSWDQLAALVSIAESGLAWNTATIQSMWNITGLRSSMLQSGSQSGLPKAELSIVEISYRLVGQQCEDPRDRIYGILGLVNDLDMEVDYGLSLVELYEKVCHIWLARRETQYHGDTPLELAVEGRERWRCICWLQLYLQGLPLDFPDTPESKFIASEFTRVTKTFLNQIGPTPYDAIALEPPREIRWSWNHRLKLRGRIKQILHSCTRRDARQSVATGGITTTSGLSTADATHRATGSSSIVEQG